ncbi:MAG: hypothetical protein WBG19_04805, partial [Thermoplasmata archaeon]
LRTLAADLARLLRDAPARPEADARWIDVPTSERSDDRVHDSIAEGRTSAPARPPWGPPPEAEANP